MKREREREKKCICFLPLPINQCVTHAAVFCDVGKQDYNHCWPLWIWPTNAKILVLIHLFFEHISAGQLPNSPIADALAAAKLGGGFADRRGMPPRKIRGHRRLKRAPIANGTLCCTSFDGSDALRWTQYRPFRSSWWRNGGTAECRKWIVVGIRKE